MNRIYVGHTGHNLTIRILEYQRCIRQVTPNVDMHCTSTIKHKYGLTQTTIWLIKTCNKEWHMNCLDILLYSTV